jgi:hypothetical protein
MKIEEINEFNFPYKSTCHCGEEYIIYTQRDDNPEYYAGIYIVCNKCNEVVEFSLPVN